MSQPGQVAPHSAEGPHEPRGAQFGRPGGGYRPSAAERSLAHATGLSDDWRMSAVRRRVAELWWLVKQGVVPRATALQMAERMYRLALPDPIVFGPDGRIIYRPEEPMSERTGISRDEMNEFWDEQIRRRLPAGPLKRALTDGLSSAIALREHYDIQRERMAARMGIQVKSDPALGPDEFRLEKAIDDAHWEQYVPADPVPFRPGHQDMRVGDVWAGRMSTGLNPIAIGYVFRVTEVSDRWVLADELTTPRAIMGGGFSTSSLVAQHARLIARDGQMVERHVPPVTMGKADGRVPCPFGCDGLRVTNPNCNYHGVKGTAKNAQAEFHAAFARTAKASAQAIADKRAARTAAPAHFCGILCVAQGCNGVPKAAPTPAPRAHDFSNPYLIDRLINPKAGRRLCVECGHNYEDKVCKPILGWREQFEAEIAIDVAHQARNRRLNRTPPPKAQPYRNDVSGIGAVMGGLHNCAPERGR